ncbi:MAG TPA: thioredoxin-disulfide reductase [Actinobacteria bacterium]|jgi:thioredoxin reductase (NADPH)|nr:thioredoxin-disulfide reductase [Actinomycetota bacterium]
MSNVDERDVVILGSGPSGLTAALYAARANLKPLVLKGIDAGGQLMLTTEVENFPGFPDAVLGPELMERMEKQAARFEAELLHQEATRVDFSQRPFRIWSGDEEWAARSVIISTGASAKMLGLDSERRLLGHGVSTCATCDGFFFRGLELLVVGGGDSALEEAIFLTRFATKVTLIHRRDSMRASAIMQDRARANPKIEFVWNAVVEEVLGDGSVAGARLRDVVTGETREISAAGLFVAIGHTPNTRLYEGQLELNEGYIAVREPTTRTSVEGVFAAGDVVDFVYRQAITAAGMGCKAAIDAERFLEAEYH